MVATSGSRLIEEEAVATLEKRLLPLASVVTPNIPEAEILSGLTIRGHSVNDANDLLYAEGKGTWIMGKRIYNPNTHGTGCTLSSAIAANLAKGQEMEEAVQNAKRYISGALADMLDLGAGCGPMNHAFDLHSEFAEEGRR